MNRSVAETPKRYQRVAATVATAIEAGRYKPGQRLPSERDLAEEFGVSRPTIREAMLALEIRGMVKARHGSGIYVTQSSPAENPRAELTVGGSQVTEATNDR